MPSPRYQKLLIKTTAGWLDFTPCSYAYHLYHEAAAWGEELFYVPSLKELRKVPGSDIAVFDMKHRQLGFTDQWLKKKIQDARSTGRETDFLNIWVDDSTSSPNDN